LKFHVLLILATTILSAAEPPAVPVETIVQNYCAAERSEQRSLNGATMEVDIQASLPNLKKHGRLRALRHISRLGRITYEKLFFEGDGTIKNQVIARYLTAEVEAQRKESPSLAVTPENYKFKYKHRAVLDGRDVYVLQVTPRRKRTGLFKGELWIDVATYLRVQETGYFVKNPSIFLKKIAFIKKYDIRDGISVPRQVQSTVQTRLVGKAELTIDYSNFSTGAATDESASQ
jgi:hypothetical protein